MKMILSFVLLLSSLAAVAQEAQVKVKSRVKGNTFDLGIGSEVELTINAEKKDALFLGRLVTQDGTTEEFLFLDIKKTRVLMIDPKNVTGFKKSASQAIIRPIDQRGGTCAAYAMFHFWNQMHEVGFKGTEELTSTMKSDRKRMQLLEEVIDIYYIQNKTNITTLMKNLGKRYGFVCKNNPFTEPTKAVDFIYNKALTGKPVLIDYNIGSDMVTSTYEVIDYENPVSPDPRLWVPRKVGQREKGGHVIVAAAAFTVKGRKKVLVVDSDWAEPRIWDLTQYLGKKAAVKEMGFHTCD